MPHAHTSLALSHREHTNQGVCSGGCKGSAADTVGVTEFDTVNGKFVGEHNSKANNGCVPFSSPDGRTIVLAPYDGGATVRVLKAGANGAASVGPCPRARCRRRATPPC